MVPYNSAMLALLLLFLGGLAALKSTCRNKIHNPNSVFVHMSVKPVSEAWVDTFKDNGIIKKGVQLTLFNNGLRGVVATQSLSTEPIVFVKSEVALEVTNNSPPSPFPDFAPNDFWKKCMWDQRLGLKLLHEMKNITSTAKSAWIDQLPKSFSTPLNWDEELIQETQYIAISKRVISQRESWQSFYKRWQSNTAPQFKNLVTLEEMYNVLENCNSRAFSGAYEGSSASDRKALFVFTLLLSIIWPLLNLSSLTESIGLGVTVGLSILARDLFLSSFANLKRYALCPYVDMFNHRSDAISDVSFNYFKSQFELTVSNDYSPGDQVYISYGKPSNDRLLQFYGFIEENNPYDIYDYGVNVLELILKYGDQLSSSSSSSSSSITQISPTSKNSNSGPNNNFEFPTNPDPSTRLKLLATALKNTNMVSKSISDTSELIQSSLSNAGSSSNSNNDINMKYFRTKMINKPTMLGMKPEATTRQPSSQLLQSSSSSSNNNNNNNDSIDNNSNYFNYLDRYDDITIRCLRVFFSTENEWNLITKNWQTASASSDNSSSNSNINLEEVGLPLSSLTEEKIINCLQNIAYIELHKKPTSLPQDEALLITLQHKLDVSEISYNDILPVLFRIEKKKLLLEAARANNNNNNDDDDDEN